VHTKHKTDKKNPSTSHNGTPIPSEGNSPDGIKVVRKDFSEGALIPSLQDIQNIIGLILFNASDTLTYNSESKISDLKTDSLDQMEAVMEIENQLRDKYPAFSIDISAGGIEGAMTVKTVVDMINTKYTNASS
jgi:acyl carrier protein